MGLIIYIKNFTLANVANLPEVRYLIISLRAPPSSRLAYFVLAVFYTPLALTAHILARSLPPRTFALAVCTCTTDLISFTDSINRLDDLNLWSFDLWIWFTGYSCDELPCIVPILGYASPSPLICLSYKYPSLRCINWSVTLNFWPWPFDLQIGWQVRLPILSFLARPFRSRVRLRNATDGRTNRHRSTICNAPFHTGAVNNNSTVLYR